MPILVEISSYPKCGNTWLKHLISVAFKVKIRGIPDIHQVSFSDSVETARLINDYQFYKSHVFDNEKYSPDQIINIYRHPLDVFLSTLNFFYIRNHEIRLKHGVKPVESMLEDGDINEYFEEFNENLGEGFFPKMLGSQSNYQAYMEHAFSSGKSVSIKYEDLIDSPLETMRLTFTKAFPGEELSLNQSNLDRINDLTRNKKDPFFWKSRKENYKHYLSDSQISIFYERHAAFIHRLGYE